MDALAPRGTERREHRGGGNTTGKKLATHKSRHASATRRTAGQSVPKANERARARLGWTRLPCGVSSVRPRRPPVRTCAVDQSSIHCDVRYDISDGSPLSLCLRSLLACSPVAGSRHARAMPSWTTWRAAAIRALWSHSYMRTAVSRHYSPCSCRRVTCRYSRDTPSPGLKASLRKLLEGGGMGGY